MILTLMGMGESIGDAFRDLVPSVQNNKHL